MALTAAGRAALLHMAHMRTQGIGHMGPGMGVNKRTAEALAADGLAAVTYNLVGGMHDVPRRQRAWSASLTDAGIAAAAVLEAEQRGADAALKAAAAQIMAMVELHPPCGPGLWLAAVTLDPSLKD